MSTLIAIIAGIAMFMILVILHELGHFRACRLTKVKVLEFGIGIPPRLFRLGKDKHGTEYTINAIPLGGFITPKGENPNDTGVYADKDSFMLAKFWSKIFILSAGVIMNLIIAWLIFTFCFVVGIKPLQVLPDNISSSNITSYLMPTYSFLEKNNLISGDIQSSQVIIEQIVPGLIGEKIGLQSGDIITSVNNKAVNTLNIGSVLKQSIGQDVSIKFIRDGQITGTNTQCPADNCILGIVMSQSGSNGLLPVKFGLLSAGIAGAQEIYAQTILTLNSLGNIGKSLLSINPQRIQSSLGQMSGPVGAVKFGEILINQGGRISFLAFAGMISLALAIFNILPIPALDGGRILGVIIQTVFRLPMKQYFTIENYINLFFFAALMILGIYILFKDLWRARGISFFG